MDKEFEKWAIDHGYYSTRKYPDGSYQNAYTADAFAVWQAALKRAASKSSDIVEELVKDINGRRGLANEWSTIDDDIQCEIKDEWTSIIAQAIERLGDK